ncbi:aminotransferase class I/II-fold pyridoxal phosphate-dependent enzyme [Bacteroidales bacterium OttesenSCG-928-I21]|nr:aminotransferase class I/II-fold pyridoxal phosphate-dependent enzyme [Bacteroidales bacterium OttesenSCG-928-I21]
MVDIFDRLKDARGPLGQYQQKAEGYFMFPELVGEIAPRMQFQGREVLTWSLNNYLGLANHPEVRKADAEGAAKFGMAAPMGARMMSGQTRYHKELEDKLAAFVSKPSAYLMNFGYQGMVSVIDSLLTRKDVVVYDSEAHACILDGLRLHIGKRFVYPHNDIDNLRKQLERATKLAEAQGGGVLVITEGVFGMAGDLGHLDKIVELKKDFKFRLMIDDAHGFGTMGKTGAGVGEHYGVQDQVDIYFATFAKSMAGIGAFVASETEIVDYLKFNMRSQIFAKSLPMPMVIGALKRLELLQNQPELKDNLWKITHALQNGLREEGFNIGNTESPVTPVYFSGSVPEGTNIVIDLRENYNIFCSIVVYPVVPKGVLMLRLIPTAVHTLEDVKETISVFKEIKKNLDAGKYMAEEMQSMKIG